MELRKALLYVPFQAVEAFVELVKPVVVMGGVCRPPLFEIGETLLHALFQAVKTLVGALLGIAKTFSDLVETLTDVIETIVHALDELPELLPADVLLGHKTSSCLIRMPAC